MFSQLFVTVFADSEFKYHLVCTDCYKQSTCFDRGKVMRVSFFMNRSKTTLTFCHLVDNSSHCLDNSNRYRCYKS